MTPTFSNISPTDAKALIDNDAAQIVDIRDEASFNASHITMAQHLDNHSLAGFIAGADRETPLIVCCYHGNSSKNAAQFLAEKGFLKVASLDGGFEQWRQLYPQHCTAASPE